MLTPRGIFINILVFIIASLYWYATGHSVPAIMGYIFISLYAYDEKLYFVSDIVAIITLLLVVYFFLIDYYINEIPGDIMHFGFGSLYMIVIYFKARAIFYPD